MATVMTMHWPEVTKAQYEQVRQDVNWEGQPPEGAKFHVAWFGGDGFHVLDLWESPAHFDQFTRERLTAAVQRAGITSAPNVEMHEAHAIFAPNV